MWVIICQYLGESHINDEGCSYLSKTNWPNLEIIHLGKNFIGAQGCLSLSKTKWLTLKEILLCKQSIDIRRE